MKRFGNKSNLWFLVVQSLPFSLISSSVPLSRFVSAIDASVLSSCALKTLLWPLILRCGSAPSGISSSQEFPSFASAAGTLSAVFDCSLLYPVFWKCLHEQSVLDRFERGSFPLLSECLHDLEYSRSRPLGLAVSGQINTQFSYLLLSHSLLNKVMGHNSKGKSCPSTAL